MKLLFDQNIFPKVLKKIAHIFLDASHTRFLGLHDSGDLEIFEYAKINNWAIVTFDSDFIDLRVIHGFPPKIIWLRIGNLTTKSISDLLLNSCKPIQEFLDSDEMGILEILRV